MQMDGDLPFSEEAKANTRAWTDFCEDPKLAVLRDALLLRAVEENDYPTNQLASMYPVDRLREVYATHNFRIPLLILSKPVPFLTCGLIWPTHGRGARLQGFATPVLYYMVNSWAVAATKTKKTRAALIARTKSQFASLVLNRCALIHFITAVASGLAVESESN